MQLGYQNNLADKEQQLQTTIEMHKDDPKIKEFVEALASMIDSYNRKKCFAKGSRNGIPIVKKVTTLQIKS